MNKQFDPPVKSIPSVGGQDTLIPADMKDFKASTKRVYEFTLDQKWHTKQEIDIAAGKNGVPAEDGLRRFRDLRPYFECEKVRIPGMRKWLYRLGRRLPTSTEEGPKRKANCTHAKKHLISTHVCEWCSFCGAFRQMTVIEYDGAKERAWADWKRPSCKRP